MLLPPEWNDFLSVLLRHRVKFLVIGGHAVAAHGYPRFTEDFDVFVEPSVTNAKRLGDALAEFGFPAQAHTWRWMAVKDRLLMLGRKPMRIDLLTGISGVSFSRAWPQRVTVQLAGLEVPVMGIEALIENKRAASRAKDLGDIAVLEEITRAASRNRSKRRPRAAKRSRTRGTRRR